jgi:hypothetical protein
MTDDPAGAGLDRFGQLKAEIIATHGVEASDPVVNTLAALRLARERMVESLAAGRHVDFTAFTRVLEMLEKHEPAIVPTRSVSPMSMDGFNDPRPRRPHAPFSSAFDEPNPNRSNGKA